MTRRRRSSSSPGSPTARWQLYLALIVVLAIGDSRCEYLMGGHLDNKEDHQPPPIQRRGDVEPGNPEASISSRTATIPDDLDSDFDLGLDLLAEQSAVDGSRTGPAGLDDKSASEEPGIAPRYRVPLVPYAFNGGQPFSLEKDPITGQIDFEKAPPLKVLDYSSKASDDEATDAEDSMDHPDSKPQPDEGVGPNEINPYSPSFHDFLNLPVRYTYDSHATAEKYPLISSSYANTKVQSGANSYNTHNHKKHHESVHDSVNQHLQPSRKTHVRPATRATTKRPMISETTKKFTFSSLASTTPKPTTTTTTTTEKPTTTRMTTTTTTEATTTSTKRPSSFPAVTTWKPRRPATSERPGVDYEATLSIERLRPAVPVQRSTTEPPRYDSPPPRTSSSPPRDEDESEDYEDGYEEYDHREVYHSGRPTSAGGDDNEGDYSYGLDFFGVGSRPSMKPTTSTEVTEATTISSVATTVGPTTTTRRSTTAAPTSQIPEKATWSTTTSRPERVTSMPLDSGDRYVGNFGLAQIPATIDNAIPSVSNNNVVHHGYHGRPSTGISAPGIVVKSTSNVVVPPGQDTVSFVLGNRQSVGGAGDVGVEYYPVRPGSMGDRPAMNFGNVGADGYPGEMIVNAGIGFGSSGATYGQRPQHGSMGNPGFDHALVSVGMPTVDVVNPGDAPPVDDRESSTPSSQEQQPSWWPSTSGPPNVRQPQPNQAQESATSQQNQFGHHVVFPSEPTKPAGDVATGNVEEHVIVVHESEIGAGNTLHLELGGQQTTSGPTTGFQRETTTLRFPGKPDDHGLPEPSESLTPPAERPNRVQQPAHRPPNYNYYHHQSHGSGNSRPNDYPRPQRVPLPPLPSSASSPPSGGFKRRPAPSLDSNLPNILPQFRPNAKVSHGHNRGDNVGTIPAGSLAHYPNTIIRRPQPPPPHHHLHHRPSSSRRPTGPSHLQRLNPPPLPPPPPPITSLRLPTPAALVGPAPGASGQHEGQPQLSNVVQKRLHQVNVGVPPALGIDERRQGAGFSQPPQQIKSRLEDDLERFSAEPPQQPPRAPFFGKRSPTGAGDHQLPEGIPRIATLQMIQQHGGDDSLVKTNLPPPYRFTMDNRPGGRHEAEAQDTEDENSRPGANRRGDGPEKDAPMALPLRDEDADRGDYNDAADAPVYVVYPVKGALDIRPTSHEDDAPLEDASVVLGKYGPQRPLPPDTLLKDSNDDADDDQHNLHHHQQQQHLQGYRPSGTTFTDSSSPQLASDFPYPLERPDPSIFTSQLRETPLLVPSEQRKNHREQEEEERTTSEEPGESQGDVDRDASVNVIPYPQDHIPFGLADHSGAISATLHRVLPGLSAVVDSSSTPIAYVYTPTARPAIRRPEDGYASLDRSPVLLQSQRVVADSGPAAPQSFMAPFVASASAEAPTKNGWSVVMLEQKPSAESVDRRRADSNIESDGNEAERNEDDGEENSEVTAEKDGKKNDGNKDGNNEDTASQATRDEQTETQTEKSDFNVENFTPQLFGGFKPIFEFPSDTDTEVGTLGDKVSGGALAIERPRSATGSEKIAERKLENV